MGGGMVTKAFAGGFFGKLTGALFIAICLALGFGPDKWAKFIVTGLPTWVTPGRAQAVFFTLAALTFIALAWPLLRRLAKLWRGIGDKVAVQSRPSASAWGRLASALIGSPFQIEFGNDDKYERTQHIDETGIFRRTIHISVFNESLDDIPDCNIKLIAATPRPNTGDSPTIFPVHFRDNFDLRSKQRKFIQIVSFAENPGNASILERDNIIISAASGGFFSSWTTIPIQEKVRQFSHWKLSRLASRLGRLICTFGFINGVFMRKLSKEMATPLQRLARMRKSFEKDKSLLTEDYKYFTTPDSPNRPMARIPISVVPFGALGCKQSISSARKTRAQANSGGNHHAVGGGGLQVLPRQLIRITIRRIGRQTKELEHVRFEKDGQLFQDMLYRRARGAPPARLRGPAWRSG